MIPTDGFTLTHPVEVWKQKYINNYEVRELLVPIYKNGNLVYQDPTLQEKQKYCQKEFETLYPEVTRITKPHGYYVDLSDELKELKNELIKEHTKMCEDKKRLMKR